MNAKEVYTLEPESVSTDLDTLIGGWVNHINEIGDIEFYDEDEKPENKAILIKTLGYVNFDGRRDWELRTVWYLGHPVMIIQNAGRESTDFYKRYITNPAMYNDMLRYIEGLYPSTLRKDDKDICDPSVDMPELTEFYGHSLHSTKEYFK